MIRRNEHFNLDEMIKLLTEYRNTFGNVKVKFEAFEYGGLCPDTDAMSNTKIETYNGERFLNVELK